jgi:hypothetical protein
MMIPMMHAFHPLNQLNLSCPILCLFLRLAETPSWNIPRLPKPPSPCSSSWSSVTVRAHALCAFFFAFHRGVSSHVHRSDRYPRKRQVPVRPSHALPDLLPHLLLHPQVVPLDGSDADFPEVEFGEGGIDIVEGHVWWIGKGVEGRLGRVSMGGKGIGEERGERLTGCSEAMEEGKAGGRTGEEVGKVLEESLELCRRRRGKPSKQ